MQAYIVIVKNRFNDAMGTVELLDLTDDDGDAYVAIQTVFPDSKAIRLKRVETTLVKDMAPELLN